MEAAYDERTALKAVLIYLSGKLAASSLRQMSTLREGVEAPDARLRVNHVLLGWRDLGGRDADDQSGDPQTL